MPLKTDILHLRDQGLSYSQIADKLGCSKSVISYHVRNDRPTRDQIRRRVHTRRNKMRRVLEDLKSITPCMDCGVQYPPYVMDLDHRPGTDKKANVSQIAQFSSMDSFLEEIAKCDIVCSNCHRIRTWHRQTNMEGAVQGTNRS